MGNKRKERVGWISVERAIFDHDFFATEPMSEREAFIWMIARAAYKDTRHRVGSRMMDVSRGTFYATHREMQRIWRWKSHYRVQKFLVRLEGEGMIEATAGPGKSHITICNYGDYQTFEAKAKPRQEQSDVERATDTTPVDDLERPLIAEIAPAVESALPNDAKPREILLNAMRVDVSGMTDTGKWIGGLGDMAVAEQWASDLGLTLNEQCAVIREVMQRKTDGPPGSFKYFTKAMQRFAGEKTAPALTPTEGGNHGPAPRVQRRGSDAKSTAVRAFVEG